MTAHVTYGEIPKEERKHLADEAYRQTPRLRVVRFAALLIALLFSNLVTDGLVGKGSAFLPRLGVHIAAALVIYGAIWELVGRRQLKAAIEKLKNA
jgi:hypothetical protein